MAVVSGGQAPYSPTVGVVGLIQGYRSRGWTPPFNLELVQRAGVTASLAPRVLQSLRLLDLIDGDGSPTPAFEGLRRVPQTEYQSALAAILQAAYAEIFQFIDPATDTEDRIRDQFRSYEPLGQLNRMVSLFLGLCVEAGLRPADAGRASRPAAAAARAVPRPTIRRGIAPTTSKPGRHQPQGMESGRFPAALLGLLESLPPPNGTWTDDERQRFVELFPKMLDFCYRISLSVVGEAGAVAEDDGQ